MDTEQWWARFYEHHQDFREWVLDGPEVTAGAAEVLSRLAATTTNASAATPATVPSSPRTSLSVARGERPTTKGGGRVLHLGCGSSTLHNDLLAAGFGSVVNVDFNEAVVQRMRKRFEAVENVSFVVADARNMEPSAFGGSRASFDCVVGKGLFDCLLSHGSEEHKLDNSLRTLRSIRALMHRGAVLIETSMFAPEKRLQYLTAGSVFDVRTLPIELNPLELPDQRFSYIYVLTPRVEAELDDEDTNTTTTAPCRRRAASGDDPDGADVIRGGGGGAGAGTGHTTDGHGDTDTGGGEPICGCE